VKDGEYPCTLAHDREKIGRELLAHVEKLRCLRLDIEKGIRSLDAGKGREFDVEGFLRDKKRLNGED
jgi:hypothetical protein